MNTYTMWQQVRFDRQKIDKIMFTEAWNKVFCEGSPEDPRFREGYSENNLMEGERATRIAHGREVFILSS